MPYTFDDKTAKAVGKEDDGAPGSLEICLSVDGQGIDWEN